MIAEYPFLLALVASFLAGISAALLRHAATNFGRAAWWLASALSVCAYLGELWSFWWALQMSLTPLWQSNLLRTITGGFLILAGVSLHAWAAVALRGRVFGAAPDAPLVTRPPYRYLRRPMALGTLSASLGAAWIVNASPLMVWCAGWFVLTLPLLELEEWELGERVPGAKRFLESTPRYWPRLRARSKGR
jgi:hypothetical protein